LPTPQIEKIDIKTKVIITFDIMERHNKDIGNSEAHNILQKFFSRYAPAKLCNKPNSSSTKLSKRPVHPNWLNITEEKSAELASQEIYQNKHFLYLTGEATGHSVFDLDRKDPLRKNHEHKIDGVEYWTQNIGDIDTIDTMVIKT